LLYQLIVSICASPLVVSPGKQAAFYERGALFEMRIGIIRAKQKRGLDMKGDFSAVPPHRALWIDGSIK
jgi:hypothetical protein